MTKRMKIWLQIPAELREMRRWIVARGDTKIPVVPRAVQEYTQWLTFEDVVRTCHDQLDLHPSFVVTLNCGWYCLDIDYPRVTPAIRRWAIELNAYVEESLNNGLHIWAKDHQVIVPPLSSYDRWERNHHIIFTGRKL